MAVRSSRSLAKCGSWLCLHVEKWDGKQEGMLVIQAADTAPGGVRGEDNHEDVEAGCRYDGESAQDAEHPVAGLVAAAGACVGPTDQKSRGGEEDDEEQTGQPGGLARDHLNLEQIQRDRCQE